MSSRSPAVRGPVWAMSSCLIVLASGCSDHTTPLAPDRESESLVPIVDVAALHVMQDAWAHDLILSIEDADLRDGLLGEPREFREVLAERRAAKTADDEILLDVIRLTLTAADESVASPQTKD